MSDSAFQPEDENKALWRPSSQHIENTRLFSFKQTIEGKYGQKFDDYQALWQWSVDHLGDCWSEIWDFCGLIGEQGNGPLENKDDMRGARYFPRAKLNYAENLLRRRDDAAAIIMRKENGDEYEISFKQLYDEVSRWQQAFINAGIGEGDRVAAYMPNAPETIIAALAASSLGAVFSSASPDFGVKGVLDRFAQVEPKILIACDGYLYNGKIIDCRDNIEAVVQELPSVQTCVLVPFVETGTLDDAVLLDDFLKAYSAQDINFVQLDFNHPLFIMFSSGTTGKPKCIVHGQGGTLIQHLKEHQLHCDFKKDDRVFYFTTCGWMMWQWLITGLASECTLLLYDGSPFYPDGKMLWDYTSKHNAKLFGTSAKFIDALAVHDIHPKNDFDLSDLRVITSTGSPLVPKSFDFVHESIKSDVHLSSISGGTDICSCFVLGNPISPVYRGEIQGAGVGMAVDVFDESGQPIPPGSGSGELVCTRPFPSMPVMFWNDEDGQRYHNAYFDRFDNIWCHGDWIERTSNNGFIIHGRSDATLNPGGVRIGTAEIYAQVEKIPGVVESIAVGQDYDGDVRVVLFVILKDGISLSDDLKKQIKIQVRTGASPRHVPAVIVQVTDIPRTKSGKVTELAVRDVIHGRPIKNLTALANPNALELYKDHPDLQ